MRGDLSSNEEVGYPLLGELSWTNGDSSYTMFLSQPSKMNTYSVVYDKHSQCWIAKYQYRAKNVTVHLDMVLTAMQKAYNWIISVAKFSEPDIAIRKWGKTLAFSARIRDASGYTGDQNTRLVKGSGVDKYRVSECGDFCGDPIGISVRLSTRRENSPTV
jgi:hypothetical protein